MYRLQLSTLAEKAKPWCHKRLGFPSKSGTEPSAQGDCVLFNALLTFAGVEEAVGYVPACIAEDGRPVRSPDLVDKEPELDGFSKDMLLGVILWTLVSRDPAPLDRLIGYLNREGCLCPKSSDRRCTLTPQMRYLTNQVALAVGCRGKLKGDWLPGWAFSALEFASALVTPLGYQCHLLSVKALIMRLLGYSPTVPAILAKRDPSNPWFLFLAERVAESARVLLSLNIQPGAQNQWAWEREDAEAAYKDSMGWDVVFMCNLLLK